MRVRCGLWPRTTIDETRVSSIAGAIYNILCGVPEMCRHTVLSWHEIHGVRSLRHDVSSAATQLVATPSILNLPLSVRTTGGLTQEKSIELIADEPPLVCDPLLIFDLDERALACEDTTCDIGAERKGSVSARSKLGVLSKPRGALRAQATCHCRHLVRASIVTCRSACQSVSYPSSLGSSRGRRLERRTGPPSDPSCYVPPLRCSSPRAHRRTF
eukprot:3573919-Prymnesium_polylepis.1